MSRVCAVTKKRPMFGKNVSHSHKKTIRRFEPNLHAHRIWLDDEKRFMKVRVSKKGLKSIDKKGVKAALFAKGQKGKQ
jgi:large subunit ribosomal protein L28